MDWFIFPIVKKSIRVCAIVFGTGVLLATLLRYLLLLFCLNHRLCPSYVLEALLYLCHTVTLLTMFSLALLSAWCARALLACQGSWVTRTLSLLSTLIFFCLVLILIPEQSIDFLNSWSSLIWNVMLLNAATTGFFAYPYTAGYAATERKLFLIWAILALLCGLPLIQLLSLLDRLFFLPMLMLSPCLDIAFAVISIILSWRLARHVVSIVSMPELVNPSMPGRRSQKEND